LETSQEGSGKQETLFFSSTTGAKLIWKGIPVKVDLKTSFGDSSHDPLKANSLRGK
jgi:hypothetical protein